ncbi:Uncharacterised protein [Mycobacteroides abscessus subsp. abscessus]|nr:Uncharacterised protein [Mycobacteroides abscessus subsp. abscessus]
MLEGLPVGEPAPHVVEVVVAGIPGRCAQHGLHAGRDEVHEARHRDHALVEIAPFVADDHGLARRHREADECAVTEAVVVEEPRKAALEHALPAVRIALARAGRCSLPIGIERRLATDRHDDVVTTQCQVGDVGLPLPAVEIIGGAQAVEEDHRRRIARVGGLRRPCADRDRVVHAVVVDLLVDEALDLLGGRTPRMRATGTGDQADHEGQRHNQD